MASMRIVSWNINGIRSVARKGFSEWIASLDADFVCLQEVRATQEQMPAEITTPEGYTWIWNSAQKKGYSGVAILTRIEPDEIITGLGVEEFDCEGRILQLVYPDWVLNCVYFPNGSASEERLDFKLRFYDAFLEDCNAWLRKGHHVVTVGDYNTCHKEMDIARPRENQGNSGFLPVERAWMDKYVENGYVDTFRHFHPDRRDAYTWWSNRGGARDRNVGWRIDYAFVDRGMVPSLTGAEVHPHIEGSDHCPISLELEPPFQPLIV